jgi:hypothetical protein
MSKLRDDTKKNTVGVGGHHTRGDRHFEIKILRNKVENVQWTTIRKS